MRRFPVLLTLLLGLSFLPEMRADDDLLKSNSTTGGQGAEDLLSAGSDDLLNGGDDLLGGDGDLLGGNDLLGGDPLDRVGSTDPLSGLGSPAKSDTNLRAESKVDPHEALWTENSYPSAETCRACHPSPVSYTHLTLPTILLV